MTAALLSFFSRYALAEAISVSGVSTLQPPSNVKAMVAIEPADRSDVRIVMFSS
jgi:hypothetical protein